MACKIYTADQLNPDGSPKDGAIGIDTTDTKAIQRLLLENIDKLTPEDFGVKKKAEPQKQGGKKDFKSVITKAISQSKVNADTKKALLAGDIEYNVLSNKEANDIAEALIAELGGIDNAVAEVNQASDKEIPPVIKVMVLGGAMQKYAELGEAAATDMERDIFRAKELNAINKLDELVRKAGQAVQAVSFVYKASEWGEKNRWKGVIDNANKDAENAANEVATELNNSINKTVSDVKGNLNEAAADVFGDNQQEIDDLKRENEELKKQLAEKPKGSKKNPIQIFKERVAKAQGEVKDAYDLLTKPTTQALLPNEIGALITVVEDMIKSGVTKASDVFETLEKTINPKFSEGFEEAYLKAKENLPDLALDTEEEIKQAADNTANNIAAKIVANNAKIAAAQQKKAAAAAQRAMTAQQNKAQAAQNRTNNAPIDLAERIKKDADSINFPKTKKQQDALTVMLRELQRKAKDFYKNTNQANKSGVELLNFAALNLNDSRDIWNKAKQAVIDLIDADQNYSAAQKQQLKDFLDNYQNSIFDTLLSNNKAADIIKEALKDKGFIDQNGNIDWKGIIGRANNSAAAKQAIEDWVVNNTTLPKYMVQPVIDQLFRRYDAIVKDKVGNAIKSLVKKANANKISPQIDKLIMLSEQGLLNDASVKAVLADQFGIVNMTPDQESEFDQLVKEYANAPIGFLKALAGENLEGFLMRVVYGQRIEGAWDYAKGEATLALMNMPSVYTMRFYGLMTHAKNAAAIMDVIGKVLLNVITSGDIKAGKAALKEANYGWQAFKSVLLSGDIGTSGAAKTEMGGVGRKYPVRTMEQLTKSRGLIPDLFAKVGDKTINLNILNTLLRSEKYNPRFAEAVDSFNWAMVNSSEQYKFLKWKAKQDNPSLSKKQAGDLAWQQMFGGDMVAAEAQAKEDFRKMGKKPTQAQMKRRVAEIMIQERSEQSRMVAEKFADEVTYKLQKPTGLLNAFGFVTMRAKAVVNNVVEELSEGSPTRKKKIAQSVASIFANSVIPFVNGVANILERAAEFDPLYGTAKAIGYGIASKVQKDEVKSYISRQRAYEYQAKAMIGAASYIIVAALLEASGEDDDDTYLTGSQTVGNQKPNTLKIFGKEIPLDMFGPLGISLAQYGDVYNELKKKKQEIKDPTILDALAEYQHKPKYLLDLSFTQGLKQTTDALQGKKGASDKYLANFTSNLALPWAGMSRQVRNFTQPAAMDRKGYLEQLYNAGGIYTNFLLDQTAVDVFGREYNRGDRYNLTGDFSAKVKPTPAELVLAKRYININQPLKDDNSSLETTDYPLVTGDGTLRVMDDKELHDFAVIAGKQYEKLVTDYYNKEKGFMETGDINKVKGDLSRMKSLSRQFAQAKMSIKAGQSGSAKAIIDMIGKAKEKTEGSGYKLPKLNTLVE
jgi:hypothetical protein